MQKWRNKCISWHIWIVCNTLQQSTIVNIHIICSIKIFVIGKDYKWGMLISLSIYKRIINLRDGTRIDSLLQATIHGNSINVDAENIIEDATNLIELHTYKLRNSIYILQQTHCGADRISMSIHRNTFDVIIRFIIDCVSINHHHERCKQWRVKL